MTQEQQPSPFRDTSRVYLDHPGIDLSGVTRRQAESFKPFQAFVATERLDPATADGFNSLLSDLFDRTGDVWLPGRCNFAPEVASTARELAQEHLPTAQVNLMLFRGGMAHIWTRLEIPQQPTLVIDPAGVLDLDRVLRIVPYFGPMIHCVVGDAQLIMAERVYAASSPLTSDQEAKLNAANKIHFPR